jgi:YHS domain-containing protein
MKAKTLLSVMATLVAAPTLAIQAGAALAAPVYVGTEGGNIAVSGYDPVSYFVGQGKPVKGKTDFAFTHEGAIYHFATAENLERFANDPAAFTPQFGGHCAWAMGRGYLAPGDPEQYAVVDGKLYLNINAAVKAKWDADRAGFIESGQKNWLNVSADAKFGG